MLKKKVLSLITAVALTLSLAVAAVPTTAHAAEEYTVTQVLAVLYATDSANVYAQPTLDIAPVTMIGQGTPVSVTGITSNGWFTVDLGGVYYVPGYGLSANGESVLNNTVSTAAATQTVAAGESDKDVQARAVAQQIADSVTGSTDLEKVRKAAQIVASYCANATYTSKDPDYKTAYGVFCKGVYTCAGSTRALGLVLECMGYEWEHVNENQYSHQWCKVTMDGQTGWADGMGGIADYGECPFAYGGTYTYNGVTYAAY